MKALTFHGKGDIRCDRVPDPKIEHGRDAIIKVTSCAICGSDLHIFDGVIPSIETGDILGHETMGEVVELGADNKKLKVGDRVYRQPRRTLGNESRPGRGACDQAGRDRLLPTPWATRLRPLS
jgi:threonine dehydrogenase-like Zn-dependent dehydrogenase